MKTFNDQVLQALKESFQEAQAKMKAKRQLQKLAAKQKDMPKDIAEIVNRRFWDMI